MRKKTFLSEKVKEFLESAAYSFLTGFAIAIVPQLDTLTLESFETGAATGILYLAVRAGFKTAFQFAIKK